MWGSRAERQTVPDVVYGGFKWHSNVVMLWDVYWFTLQDRSIMVVPYTCYSVKYISFKWTCTYLGGIHKPSIANPFVLNGKGSWRKHLILIMNRIVNPEADCEEHLCLFSHTNSPLLVYSSLMTYWYLMCFIGSTFDFMSLWMYSHLNQKQ